MKIPFIDQSELPISNNLKAILSNTLRAENKNSLQCFENEDDLIFNFRDPSYSAERGGYHPVEIRLIKDNDLWKFDYITDFCFVGSGFCAELTKEIDFDIGNNEGYHLWSGNHSLAELRELFLSWQENFISYVEMKCFTVSVSCN